jgi:hypothetical protein
MGTKQTTTSSSTPTFTGAQSGLQDLLSKALGTSISNGGMTDNLKTEQAGATGAVNNQYEGLSQRLQTSLSGRGFGTSGKVVTGQENLDVARANDIGGLQSQFAGLAQQNQQQSMQQALGFSFAAPGENSTSTKTTSGAGTVIAPLMQAAGLAFGLAKMGSGGGGLMSMFGGGAGGGGMGAAGPMPGPDGYG